MRRRGGGLLRLWTTVAILSCFAAGGNEGQSSAGASTGKEADFCLLSRMCVIVALE